MCRLPSSPAFLFSEKFSLFALCLCYDSFSSSSFLLASPYKSFYSAPMVEFSKICRSDGIFKADDIILNRTNTIKVFGESKILMGLQLFVPKKETCISEFW